MSTTNVTIPVEAVRAARDVLRPEPVTGIEVERALEAAAPAILAANTAADAVTPTLQWGIRPDGTPWLLAVDFGRFVTLDAYGRVMEHRLPRTPTVEEWEEKALGLLAAVEWVRSGRTAELEAAKAKEEL